MTCQDERWAELVVGRALDALEPRDDAELEAHVATCPDCVALLADMRHVSATMAYAVDDVAPPADLFDRIRASLPPAPALVAETPVVVQLDEVRRRRLLPGGRRVVAALAASAVAASLVVFGAYAAHVRGDRDQARSSLSAESTVIRALQDGTAYSIPLSSGGQASGFAVVDGRSVSLVTSNLNNNDSHNSIYVLWAASSAGQPLKAVAGFDVHGGGVSIVSATLPSSVVAPKIFGVTEEKGRALPAIPGRAVLGVSNSDSNA